MKDKLTTLFTGNMEISKRDLWLIGAVCALAGIVIGLVNAPLTHGFHVSCGNNNGNNNGVTDWDDECDCDCEEDACECVGVSED